MTYRWPVFIGDRVAVAPHTDLFMQGCRFGIVTEITRIAALYDARLYRVEFEGAGHGKVANLRADSLLGAVNARPGGGGLDMSGEG